MQLALFDSQGHGLEDIAGLAQRYMTDAKELDSFLQELVPELQSRKKEYTADGNAQFTPLFIVIDDLPSSFEQISNDSVNRLDAIMRLGKGLNVYLAAAGNADELTRLYNRGERLVMGFAGSKTGILLGDSAQKHGVFTVALPYSEMNVPLGEYEGYLLSQHQVIRFKAMHA
jgi:hypothetical protein